MKRFSLVMRSVRRILSRRISYLVFILNGKKPWSFGYNVYKETHIKRVIAEKRFDIKKLYSGYGYRIDERIIEYPWFLSRLPLGKGKMLDAGSTLNKNYIITNKAIAEKELFISTLAPEADCFWRKGINYVYQDLRDTCYRDNFFDWIVSISTIEHIGLDNTFLYTNDKTKNESNPNSYLLAIKEFHRLLRPGGVLFLTLPFGKYKNHGWFQVFDGKMLDNLIEAFSPASYSEYHFKYESDGWLLSTREASKDATCFDIHFQKEYDEDFAAFSRGLICLEMVK